MRKEIAKPHPRHIIKAKSRQNIVPFKASTPINTLKVKTLSTIKLPQKE